MGGPRRTPKESVDALEEALAILRGFWSGERAVSFAGEHYRVKGAHPGPPPAHSVGIWLGAYGPRMLRLTGRVADGWLPSLGGHYLAAEDAAKAHAAIDEAARRAGRDPAEIERAVNVMALDSEAAGWPDQLARIASELRFSTLLVTVPPDDALAFVRRLGEDTAPRVRELLD
jgi:alkanesulfonate monooxygenase SsuD/methylene tetrahydromethanopterin reductase-like flavin-dependent oxidoreductase (luciferase family)